MSGVTESAAAVLPESFLEGKQPFADDPVALLRELECIRGDVESALEDQESCAGIDPDKAPVIVRDFQGLVGQYVWTCIMERMDHEGAEESLADYLTTKKAELREEILQMLNTYGDGLVRESRKEHRFMHAVTYDESSSTNVPTYANFRHLLDQRSVVLRDRKDTVSTIDSIARDSLVGKLPGIQHLVIGATSGVSAFSSRSERIDSDLNAMWQSPDVRMAHRQQLHREYITDVRRGRPVTEGPSTIHLFNRLHASLYGSRASQVAGPMLVGPPGWGKTRMLEDYFRQHGIMPISVDIDPGQSAFTLMARPTLAEESGVLDKHRLVRILESFTAADVLMFIQNQSDFARECGVTAEEIEALEHMKQDYEDLPELRQKLFGHFTATMHDDLAVLLTSHLRTSGFVYCSILACLQKNQPIILNEFPEIPDWTFIHSLLTSTPASDEDAAPRPEYMPRNDETVAPPVGWYFDTITAQWMRVGTSYRICATGNIGPEFGGSSNSPALVRRFRAGIIGVDGMEPEEQAEAVAWPHLSADDGRFLLDDLTAYRLHFLITEVLPKLRERLERDQHGEQKYLVSISLIKDICRAMNPLETANPVDIDTALMRIVVRPTKDMRYMDALKTVIAVLKGSGFLAGKDEELKQIEPELGSEALTKLIAELTDPFQVGTYEQHEDRYEERCPVCSVKKCPCHGESSKKFSQHVERTASLAKIGMDAHILRATNDRMRKFADNREWGVFLACYFGSKKTATLKLTSDDDDAILLYLEDLVDGLETRQNDAPRDLPVIAQGVEKVFISEERVRNITKPVREFWHSKLHNSIGALSGGDGGGGDTAAFLRNNLLPFLEVHSALQSIFSRISLTAEEQAELVRAFDIVSDGRTLWLASQLRANTTRVSDCVEKNSTGTGAGDLSQVLVRARQELFGVEPKKASGSRVGKKTTKRKLPQAIAETPRLEMDYSKLCDVLEQCVYLTDLGVVAHEEVHDIVGHAHRLMEATTLDGKVPKAVTPYIRVMKYLSRLKDVVLDEALSTLLASHTLPLPPLKHF